MLACRFSLIGNAEILSQIYISATTRQGSKEFIMLEEGNHTVLDETLQRVRQGQDRDEVERNEIKAQIPFFFERLW